MITTTVKSGKVKGATGRMQRVCPLCESAELDYEFIVENCPLCCCRECLLTFLNPQPDASEPGTHPAEAGADVYEIHATNAERRLDQFVSYAGTRVGRLLLVGVGQSHQDEAARRGFELVCLTPAEFDNYSPNDGGGLFAGCILNCALEQSSDPLARLATVRSLLSPDGCLMVIAPTLDSRTARVFDRRGGSSSATTATTSLRIRCRAC